MTEYTRMQRDIARVESQFDEFFPYVEDKDDRGERARHMIASLDRIINLAIEATELREKLGDANMEIYKYRTAVTGYQTHIAHLQADLANRG